MQAVLAIGAALIGVNAVVTTLLLRVMDARFERVDAKFERVDTRFEMLAGKIDHLAEVMDLRLRAVEGR